MISEEEAANSNINNDLLAELQQEDSKVKQQSFLKEFEERHGCRVVAERSAIKSSFMCCIIEQEKENEEEAKTRFKFNCILF